MKRQLKVKPKPKQPAHRRIYEGLLAQITAGKLPLGTQLPSTHMLAEQWDTNTFTVHTALTALTRDGWLHRRHGSGTFIADPATRFSCAGIYQDAEIGIAPDQHFQRFVQSSLIRRLESMKKRSEIFLDSRPREDRDVILPLLEDAIRQGRIQCLFALHWSEHNVRSFTRLSLPIATAGPSPDPRHVNYDNSAFFRESVQRLKARGCRSVGMVSSVARKDDAASRDYFGAFDAVLEESGLRTHETWISNPKGWVYDMEKHGYSEFRRLWKLRSRPDGVIVYPDILVRGVILGVLEAGKEDVVRQMKFVLHRNAHFPIFCPIPATWATSREDLMADAMIEIIQKQFRRETVSPILIPLTFSDTPADQT